MPLVLDPGKERPRIARPFPFTDRRPLLADRRVDDVVGAVAGAVLVRLVGTDAGDAGEARPDASQATETTQAAARAAQTAAGADATAAHSATAPLAVMVPEPVIAPPGPTV
jgi:hypothetical protein